MASVLKYSVDSSAIRRDLQCRFDHARSMERIHFIKARKIQAWIRGILTRNHLKRLNKFAIVIQKNWRRYSAKIYVKKLRLERQLLMIQNHRNQCATMIQATWKGYKSRKCCYDYYKMKRWLQKKQAEQKEVMLKKQKEKIKKLDEESKPWVLFILKKLHHLRGTQCCPGVITKIDQTHSTTIEQLVKYLGYRMFPIDNP